MSVKSPDVTDQKPAERRAQDRMQRGTEDGPNRPLPSNATSISGSPILMHQKLPCTAQRVEPQPHGTKVTEPRGYAHNATSHNLSPSSLVAFMRDPREKRIQRAEQRRRQHKECGARHALRPTPKSNTSSARFLPTRHPPASAGTVPAQCVLVSWLWLSFSRVWHSIPVTLSQHS